MRRGLKFILTLITITAVLFIAACSGGENESNGNNSSNTGNQGTGENTGGTEGTTSGNEGSSDKIEINFWHAMGGAGQQSLEEIVASFNESQDKIVVHPEYQGSYEELLTKFRSVGGTNNAPALIQVFEVGTKFMIDSGYIEPVQKFIDEDQYDLSQLEDNILNYYRVDGELYSMPFNSSTPVLIYNKDAFIEAGLDPDNPPVTFNEIKEAAAKLTKMNGDATEQYGFSVLGYGWFFEELLATQGALYVNNDNGRSDQATEAVFNGEEGLRIFTWLDEMNKAGTFGYFGTNWDDIRAAFQTGKVAMYMDSSAGLGNIIRNSPFEVGAGFIPHADEVERQGVIIGGASLWMSAGIEAEKQKAAFEFMKFLTTPEIQAKWHLETGYFAINPDAYSEDIVKELWEEYPQLKVTVDQLQATKPSFATQGALISVFPESRQQVVTAMENLYQGMDPQEALDRAKEETDRQIEIANRTNQ